MKRLYCYTVHACVLLSAYFLNGQGTLQEYKKAIALDSLFKEKVWNAPEEFHWIDNTQFWYANTTEKARLIM